MIFLLAVYANASIEFVTDKNPRHVLYGDLSQNDFDGILETRYNAYAPTITRVVSGSIPEPVTLLLLGFGGVSLLIRKR